MSEDRELPDGFHTLHQLDQRSQPLIGPAVIEEALRSRCHHPAVVPQVAIVTPGSQNGDHRVEGDLEFAPHGRDPYRLAGQTLLAGQQLRGVGQNTLDDLLVAQAPAPGK
ncbi:hypothetical protein [Streptomyces sp. NPDC005953]|uniref:hypothetical protein n=1 Tax=Streptomyces sp. NPDC005953 TaxID=3156719 RepID=UPI0033D519EC